MRVSLSHFAVAGLATVGLGLVALQLWLMALWSGWARSDRGRSVPQQAPPDSRAVSSDVLLTALTSRFSSRGLDRFASNTLSAMRDQFGGHAESRALPKLSVPGGPARRSMSAE